MARVRQVRHLLVRQDAADDAARLVECLARAVHALETAFMGYMEGALSSGYRLARRLAVRDGIFPA